MDTDLDHIGRRGVLRFMGGAAAVASATMMTDHARPAFAASFGGTDDRAVLHCALAVEEFGARYHETAVGGAKFVDAGLVAYAADLAASKRDHAGLLRDELGAAAAVSPAIGFAPGPASPFSVAARTAGVVGAGATFDPFVGERSFLIGAFLIEDAGAAGYRALLPRLNTRGREIIARLIAGSIHHGGLVRTLLHERGWAIPGRAAARAGDGLHDDPSDALPYRLAPDAAWRVAAAHYV